VTSAITLRIGIASREQIKRRSIEIAAGKRRRQPDEPRIWFTSLDAILRVLSDKNMLLLEMIRTSQPGSVTELAEKMGDLCRIEVDGVGAQRPRFWVAETWCCLGRVVKLRCLHL
jgi:predicted transcriptional regulator